MDKHPSGTQFFPTEGFEDWAFDASYKDDFPTLGKWAENTIMARKGGTSNGALKIQSNQAIAQLEAIQNAARASENAFLAKYGFPSGKDNWSELIIGLNKILGTEASFKRNLNLLQQVADGDRKTYQDISRFLKDKLQEAAYEVCQSISFQATGGEIAQAVIQKALIKLSQVTDTTINGKVNTKNPNEKKNEQALQAFVELYGNIQVIQGNAFFKGMVDLFHLDSYIEQVRAQLQNQSQVSKKDRIEITPKGGHYYGTLQELLDAAVNSSLYGSGKNRKSGPQLIGRQVGGLNYKPDVILANVEADYNGAADQAQAALHTRSVRTKGIETMERLFQNMKNAKGDIVLISNKNYLINEMFKNGTDKHVGGFAAQGDTNLTNLGALFSKVHLPNVEGLIDYLRNAGDGMIAGDIDDSILHLIAARIGDFLFDDMEITPPSGLNVVHVFNLSGIYVPLSFVLEGIKNGLKNLDDSNSLDDYVEVTFKSSPTDAPDWTETAFKTFKQKRMKETKMSVHFMRDFAQIITSAVNI